VLSDIQTEKTIQRRKDINGQDLLHHYSQEMDETNKDFFVFVVLYFLFDYFYDVFE